MKVKTFSSKGTKLADLSLPREISGEVNLNLLAQAVRVYEDRGHKALSLTKTRAQVERTKKKWYRQKGTGGARHGARSAPIFVGGGTAHGPKGIKKELSLSKKLKNKARISALVLKAKQGDLVLVRDLAKIVKTSQAKALTDKIAKATQGKRFTVVFSDKSTSSKRAFRNLKNVKMTTYKDLNAYIVFFGGVLIVEKSVFGKTKREVKK